jgi:puromycin-sensitive aminopeptidase
MCAMNEPVECRSIMPCFDEPVFKAYFKIHMKVTEPSHIAISNAKIEGIIEENDERWYEFSETPLMSTYLLSLVIGKFDYIERTLYSGVNVRVYTPTGLTHKGEYALDLAIKALQFYEEYFEIPYPLQKLDLVSLHSMHVRAMESWGCVTFAEYTLLMDFNSTDSNTIIRNARTICHEISHMWFGNLVTMEWWTDIWLNEGFARFAEFFVIDHIYPEYHIWDQFLNDVLIFGIKEDQGSDSHPIEVKCQHPDQIGEIFDGISYAKGSSIIRMINAYIGEDSFKTAIKKYINKYQYE